MAVRRVIGWLRLEILLGTLGLAVAVACGLRDPAAAAASVEPLWPVVGFLVSVLVVAHCCGAWGLFTAVGERIARAGAAGTTRMVALTFLTAAATTALLNLDATIVLLTPVAIAVALRSRVPTTPVAWVCVRLANSASLLFSVSNLTNLLAASQLDLTFAEFVRRTWPVWVVVLVLEWVALRVAFVREFHTTATPSDRIEATTRTHLPMFPCVVVLLMLGGFVIGSSAGIDPAWPAAGAALVLAGATLRDRLATVAELVAAANLPLGYLVLCWALAAEQLAETAAGRALIQHLPLGDDTWSTVALALVAMLLANMINNLPAALVLIPLAAPAGVTAVLAVLIGVNVGANLTYLGSLANLLWLRTTDARERPSARRFHLIAATTTPLIVALGALTLSAWASRLG